MGALNLGMNKVTVPDNLKHLGVLGYLVATLAASIENRGYKLALDRGYLIPKVFNYPDGVKRYRGSGDGSVEQSRLSEMVVNGIGS